jgi:hypothetical protein
MAAVLKTAMGLPPSRVRIPCPPQPLQDQQRRLTGSVGGPSYDAGMADDVYEAADVAVELRRRLPGVGVKKLHKLLYDCQGHHLADVGRPVCRVDCCLGHGAGCRQALEERTGESARSECSNARPRGAQHDRLCGESLRRADRARPGDLVSRRAAVGSCTPAWAIRGDRSPKVSRRDMTEFSGLRRTTKMSVCPPYHRMRSKSSSVKPGKGSARQLAPTTSAG